ncbi:MAG: preprotein translocase subunit SecE [Candidatus Caenarcaniphilales bacterium]|nr:preprotein translocase subunit SecE [Candidatus Caenarcaniphilales bacterium]
MPNKSTSSIDKFVNYLKDVQRESKQITWPAFDYAFFQFLIVIALSSALTCLLYFIDIGLVAGIKQIKTTFLK